MERAKAGDPEAQLVVATMYLAGQGVTKNSQEAAAWLRRAAEQRVPRAQGLLGLMFLNGEGVPKDVAEAVRWTRLAAEQGFGMAQTVLGTMYFNGVGVVNNDVEAVRWTRLAAGQGEAEAQFNLGLMYANGRGVPKDAAEAMYWYRLSAEQGQATAQNNIAAMLSERYSVCRFSDGLGVVEVTRTPGDRSVETDAGPTRVSRMEGIRVMFAYPDGDYFVNLHADLSRRGEFQSDKEAIVAQMARHASPPSFPLEHTSLHGFDVYALNDSPGGVISHYSLFDDHAEVTLTVYFLNQRADRRRFQTAEEYHTLRDRFLEAYLSCVTAQSVPE